MTTTTPSQILTAAPAAPETGDEPTQARTRGLEAAGASVRRRWVLLGVSALLLVYGATAGDLTVPTWAIVAYLGMGTAANAAASIVVQNRWYTVWLIPILAGIDVLLSSVLIAAFGSVMAVIVLGAVLPYAQETPGWRGFAFLAPAAAVTAGGAGLHALWVTESPPTIVPLLIVAGAFMAAGALVRQRPSELVARIRLARGFMEEATVGNLGVRAPADRSDELGALEQAFNEMLEAMAHTIFAVQKEADEVAILAEVLAQAAEGVLSSSDSVATTASSLAEEMSAQRDRAEAGQQHSREALAEAEGLRDRAELVARDSKKLVESARVSRESVQRAGATLVAIGDDVEVTASTVKVLSGMSQRIGNFAHRISRIARQTHVLALNAAIEAAHTDREQQGFSAVAEEIRMLAGDAAESAREVTEVIEDVQSRIGAVARAMGAGQEKVRDVGEVATEAQGALNKLYRGTTQMTELVLATADVSKHQASRMATLAQKMSEISTSSGRSYEDARGAADAMAAQKSTVQDLNTVSQQLAHVADRVRSSIARFEVLRPGQTTGEFAAVSREDEED